MMQNVNGGGYGCGQRENPMLTKRRWLRLLLVALVLVLFAAGTHALFTTARHPSADTSAQEPLPSEISSYDSDVLEVNVIQPRRDPAFTMTVSEPASVEAYYTAQLKAKVSGSVHSIYKDIGARVKKDEVLAVIDVPDLLRALAQTEQVIKQRQREEELARAKVKVVQAEIEAAASSLVMKKKLLKAADAIQKREYTRWQHFKGLGQLKGVDELLVEEQEEKYLSAYANYEAANEAITRAQAQLSEAKQNLEVAKADVAFKHSLIEVAEKDRDKAKALADYTEIRAPFDGVIVKRSVDPGSFVDVGAGNSEPLFVVERTDIVTVYTKVPDTFAPYVTDGTEAIISMTSLPGVKFRGKVTRHDPSLQTSHTDLTMRVEVDLWNDSQRDYAAWIAAEQAKPVPFDDLRTDDLKRPVKPWPPSIEISNANAPPPHLLPGMYGTMALVLRTFRDAYLLPSDALVQQGGQHYIYLLKNGKAEKVLVILQAEDGRLAKVVLVFKKGNQQLIEELTGNDQVIYSRLSELSPGESVHPVPVAW
jgi:multidrug resistance efflux pump